MKNHDITQTTIEQARKAGIKKSTEWNHAPRTEAETSKFIDKEVSAGYCPAIKWYKVISMQDSVKRGLPIEKTGVFYNPPKLKISKDTLNKIKKD